MKTSHLPFRIDLRRPLESPPLEAVSAQYISNRMPFLVAIFSYIIWQPSQKYGLPFPVILRSSFGISGARYIGMLRGVVGMFMFGVQTFFISKSIGYLIRILVFNID